MVFFGFEFQIGRTCWKVTNKSKVKVKGKTMNLTRNFFLEKSR